MEPQIPWGISSQGKKKEKKKKEVTENVQVVLEGFAG